MAFIKFHENGGSLSIFPIMEGGMNCGYTMGAYLHGSYTPFKTISGSKTNPVPLIFEDSSLIPENTVIIASFQFRAGNGVLVNSPYTIGLHGKQDGNDLQSKVTKEGSLPEKVKTSQVSATLISANTITILSI